MSNNTSRLSITAPDDWHIHLRDGSALSYTVADVAQSFERAIIMPNLVPPVCNAQQALAYRERITQHVPKDKNFEPLMVLYLTDNTSVEDIVEAKKAGVVACKLYPAGATTNSDSGVTNISKLDDVLNAMEEHQVKLLIHGEVTDSDIDIFDREAIFIDRTLNTLVNNHPNLKVVFEHITTKDAVEFVKNSSSNVAATITAHHLLFNRNHMLAGGIRPHYFCLPILKRDTHQHALIDAAISGDSSFFLGTDSAPHARSKKESACGCAGSYTAFHAIELYAEVFDRAGALDKLDNFAGHFGPDFYELPRNTGKITLEKQNWSVPDTLPFDNDTLVPIMAGQTLSWRRV